MNTIDGLTWEQVLALKNGLKKELRELTERCPVERIPLPQSQNKPAVLGTILPNHKTLAADSFADKKKRN